MASALALTIILTCKSCGGHKLKPDTHGALEILVCEDCGTYTEAQLGGDADEYHAPFTDIQSIADGPSHQGKFHAPSVYKKVRERKFKRLVTEMASNVRLSEHETKLCIEEGMALLPNEKIFNMKNFAAGLVFIALQRTSATVSFRDVGNLVNVKYKVLGKTVKKLKLLLQESQRPNVNATDEEKMQEVVDQLPPSVTLEQKVEAKKLALELKELFNDLKVQGSSIGYISLPEEYQCFVGAHIPLATRCVVSTSHSSDCALVAMVLESVSKRSRDGTWVELLAQHTPYKESSLTTRLCSIRSELLNLAQKLPSLGSKVDSKEITTRNIQKYIPVIVRNKQFFLVDPDRQLDEDHRSPSPSPPSEESSSLDATPTLSVSTDLYHRPPSPPLGSEDEEENLSYLDPDIDQYIASPNEVVVKRRKRKIMKDSSL